MSLINKVLRDLERQRTEDNVRARRSPLAEAELKPVHAVRRGLPSRTQWIRLVSLLALVTAAVFAWVQWGGALRKGEPPPVVQAPPLEKTAAAPTSKPPREEAPTASKDAPPAPKADTAPSGVKRETAKIESTAKSPGSPLVPAPAAPAPRPSVADVIVRKPRERDVPIALPRDAKPQHMDVPTTVPKQAEPETPSVPAAPEVPEKTVTAKAAAPSPVEPEAELGETGEAPASGPPAVVEPGGKAVLEKKIRPLTPEQRAENEYRLAATALQNRRSGEAESRLRTALAAQATHLRARELLAGLLLRGGRWRDAQSQLEQGAALHPMHYPFAQLLARVYVDHGQEKKALALLEKTRAAGSGDADYLAFLATLQQRAGRHDAAAHTFNEALALRPQEGRWWLGIAISLEATGKWKESAEAYRRAAASGNLDPKLLQYSQQRLAVVKNK